ncbi:MAG TPA: hypothetical protein VF680_16770 [Allosphingosinicella sp.]|jgi:hypothetical protein
MTEAQLCYSVREGVRQHTDDTDISDRYIMYLFNLKRSKFLRNDLNNLQKTIDQSVIQTLCMELEEVHINECNVDYDCGTIMRTKLKLPSPIELHLKSAVINVKPTNRLAVPFNFVNKTQAIWSKYSSFGRSIYAFLDNDDYIYLVSESDAIKLIECISVSAIFEDPMLLKDFNNCCGCQIPKPCYDPLTTEYPLQAHHVDNITEEIIKTLIRKLQLPEDETNNADDK